MPLGAKPRGFPRTVPSAVIPTPTTAKPQLAKMPASDAPRRNKAVKPGFGDRGAEAQWETLDDEDFNVTTTKKPTKVIADELPPPPITIVSAETAAYYAKKYVSGSVSVVGCKGLFNHTTSTAQIQTNPYVLVYADTSKEDPTPKVILQTPHLKNNIAPTYDTVSSTIDFELLSTSFLTIQVWHHSINKTMRTKGKGAEDEDLFIGEVKVPASDISDWLSGLESGGADEASSPKVRQGTDEEFIVHHVSGTPADKKLPPGGSADFNSSFRKSKRSSQYLTQLPLKARQKEKDAAAKAASSKGELGVIDLAFGPASQPSQLWGSINPNPTGLTKGKQRGLLVPSDKVDGYITLLRGCNLLGWDVVTLKSDPYMVVYYPNLSTPVYRTDTQTNTLRPEWVGCDPIPVDKDDSEATITIDVWNENPLPEKDNFLGRASIPVSELPASDRNELTLKLAPRPKEKDADIARLVNRLGEIVLSWKMQGSVGGRPVKPSSTAAAMGEKITEKAGPRVASAAASETLGNQRALSQRTPSQRTPSAAVGTITADRKPPTTYADDVYIPPQSSEPRVMSNRTTVSRGVTEDESGVADVYIPPQKSADEPYPKAGSARPNKTSSRTPPPAAQAEAAATKASQPLTTATRPETHQVSDLDPKALHSLMATLNTSNAMLNLSQMLTISKPVELPKHKSMYFTAEDYAKYGARPPTANAASPYAPVYGQTVTPPGSSQQYPPVANNHSDLYRGTNSNIAQGMPPSASGNLTALGSGPIAAGRVGSTALVGAYNSGSSNSRGGLQACSHTAFDGVCDECYRYAHTAMPPANEVYTAPPLGSVPGETHSSIPLTMTTIVPIRLTADKIRSEKDHNFKPNVTEHFIKMSIDEPNLKPILQAAERLFNIHPASAMLLYNGEQLNPMQSLRESGVLLLKGDGAIHVKVQMFKGQRVNIAIKIAKVHLGVAAHEFHQQQGGPQGNQLTSVAGKGGPNVFIPLSVDSEWTISDLKKMFSAHARCPPLCRDPSNYHLYFRYNRLVGNMKVDYYRLPNGCELEATPKDSEVVKEIQKGRLTQHRDANAKETFTDDRTDDFHEEDIVGIPRRKTALELRKEKREGRGSAAAATPTVASARARSAAQVKTPKAGAVHTVTKSSASHPASTGGHTVLAMGVPRSGIPISPLGAPELAVGLDESKVGRGVLPSAEGRLRGRGRIGDALQNTNTVPLSNGGVATYSDHVDRPEWDDRNPIERPMSSGGTGRLRPTTAPSRPTSPSHHLNDEERHEAMDIRPSDWRSTLRTLGRKNLHVPMGPRPDSRAGNGTSDFTYSYAVRPLSEADRQALASKRAEADPSGHAVSPLRQAQQRAASGQLIYGVTSDAAKPIYGNDYRPLTEYSRSMEEHRRLGTPMYAPSSAPQYSQAYQDTYSYGHSRPSTQLHTTEGYHSSYLPQQHFGPYAGTNPYGYDRPM